MWAGGTDGSLGRFRSTFIFFKACMSEFVTIVCIYGNKAHHHRLTFPPFYICVIILAYIVTVDCDNDIMLMSCHYQPDYAHYITFIHTQHFFQCRAEMYLNIWQLPITKRGKENHTGKKQISVGEVVCQDESSGFLLSSLIQVFVKSISIHDGSITDTTAQ